MMNVGSDGKRDLPRAAATESSRNSDVLFPVNAERNWEALNRSSQARVPKHRSVVHIHCLESSIQVAGESDSTGRRKHGCQERRSLLDGPHLLHRFDIERSQFSNVAIASRHLRETPLSRGPARS